MATYPVIPVRWQRDAPRVVRDDLDLSDHPLSGTLCPHCDAPLTGADPVALVAVGPDPADPDDVAKHEAGRWYTANGVMTHAGGCADAFAPAVLDATLPTPEG